MSSSTAGQSFRPVLRNYQQQMVHEVLEAIADGRRVLAVGPTGAGKTVMFSALAEMIVDNQMTVMIVAHTCELIEQTADRVRRDTGLPVSIVMAQHKPDATARITVGSIQTLTRRLAKLPPPDLLVIDEAHHAVAANYTSLIEAWPNALLVGFTATPQRLDGKGLGRNVGGHFDLMVQTPPAAALIDQRYLVPPRVFAPTLDGIGITKMQMGEYDPQEAARVMRHPKRIREVVETWQQRAVGRRGIVFCTNVQHAREQAEAMRSHGIKAQAVDGRMTRDARKAAFDGFRDGSIDALTSCALVSEGIDVADCGVVAMARPTKSLTIYLQQCGRGARIATGKDDYILLDHAANVIEHGLPTADREWSLDGTIKQPKMALRKCPRCEAVIEAAATACPHCGLDLSRQAREEQPVPTPRTRVLEELRARVAPPVWRQTPKGWRHGDVFVDRRGVAKRMTGTAWPVLGSFGNPSAARDAATQKIIDGEW